MIARSIALFAALACIAPARAQAPAPKPQPRCAVTEDMVVGPWQHVKGGFFQEMELAREDGRRVFNSWLHQRPEYSGGEWTLADCRLTIRIESAKASFEFASVRVSGNRLYLREEGAKAEAVYKRIKP